jgi:hypothetical protein
MQAGRTNLDLHTHVKIKKATGDPIRRDLEGLTGELVEPIPSLDNEETVAGILLDHRFRILLGCKKVNVLRGDVLEVMKG